MGKDLRHHAQDPPSRTAVHRVVLHADCRRLQPRQAAKIAGCGVGMRLTAPEPVKNDRLWEGRLPE